MMTSAVHPKEKFGGHGHPLLMILTFLTLPGPSTWRKGTDCLEYETPKILDHDDITEEKHDTLPETNGLPLKLNGWKMNFLLRGPILRGYVSFREGV